MTFKAYTNPDFTIVQKLLYLLITFAFLGISILIISGVSKLITPSSRNRKGRVERNFEDKVQRLFEMIIAGASVMSFSCAYVVINHIYDLVLYKLLFRFNDVFRLEGNNGWIIALHNHWRNSLRDNA